MKRNDTVVLGRIIGTNTGWDEVDYCFYQVYDFQPVEGLDIPEGPVLYIDYERGRLVVHNEDGQEWVGDMLDVLAGASLEKFKED